MRQAGRWRFTPKGLLVSNQLIGQLLEAQQAPEDEASRVVDAKRVGEAGVHAARVYVACWTVLPDAVQLLHGRRQVEALEGGIKRDVLPQRVPHIVVEAMVDGLEQSLSVHGKHPSICTPSCESAIIGAMRRLVTLLMLLLPFGLFAAVHPVDSTIGQTGEGTELLCSAMAEPYSLSWLESYVDASWQEAFAAANSTILAKILPLSNPVMGELEEGRIHIKDLDSGLVVTVFLTDEGLIRSLSI